MGSIDAADSEGGGEDATLPKSGGWRVAFRFLVASGSWILEFPKETEVLGLVRRLQQ